MESPTRWRRLRSALSPAARGGHLQPMRVRFARVFNLPQRRMSSFPGLLNLFCEKERLAFSVISYHGSVLQCLYYFPELNLSTERDASPRILVFKAPIIVICLFSRPQHS